MTWHSLDKLFNRLDRYLGKVFFFFLKMYIFLNKMLFCYRKGDCFPANLKIEEAIADTLT